LERAKAIDKIPKFLKPKIPTVKFFPEDSAVSLRKSYEEMQLEQSFIRKLGNCRTLWNSKLGQNG
jgi:hypothetical protein